MSSPINSQFPSLTFTKNNLTNAINFLNQDNVVVLFAKGAFRAFYAIPSNAYEMKDIHKVRVIYIDCNSAEYVLEKDHWDFFFESTFKNRLIEYRENDPIGKMIFDQKPICHKEYIALLI